METGQGLGVTVGLQTDGTLDLFLQQFQRLCESPARENNHITQYQELTEVNCNIAHIYKWVCLVIFPQTYFFGVGASAILEYSFGSLDAVGNWSRLDCSNETLTKKGQCLGTGMQINGDG